MKVNMSGLFSESCVTWPCECSPNGPEIPITEVCPQCGKTMPQNIRNFIYDQVKRELKGEISYEQSIRKGERKRFIRKVMPFVVIGVIVLVVTGLWLLMPELFRPVVDWAVGAWEWTLDLPTTASNALGDFWQWLCAFFADAGAFLEPTLNWLGEVAVELWAVICWAAVILWDLLLMLIDELPTILGWLWEILLFLGNQVWVLIQFLIEAIPAVFALAIGLLGQVFQLLVMLLGMLWEAITGIISMFF